MNYIKNKAFTMAEVMILLLTLSVLMAAFAPVMTKRQHNVSYDDVWTYVPSDNHNDAYFDAANKSFTSQAFIGIPVKKALDVSAACQAGSVPLYSKLVIRSAETLKGISGITQSQMQFRYGDKQGTYLGSLLAGHGNFLLGGEYKNVQPAAVYNTAYGDESLSNLTTGQNNTAAGYLTFNILTTGSNNTAIGSRAGRYTTGDRNTFAGRAAGAYVTGDKGNDNTIIGGTDAGHIESTGYSNTILGSLFSYKEDDNTYNYQLTSGSGNTAVGYSSLINNKTGNYNTAVGSKSLRNLTEGYNNTAIGYNTGDLLTKSSNKTFVGAFSGTVQDTDTVKNNTPLSGLYKNDEVERVFIGSIPRINGNLSTSRYTSASSQAIYNTISSGKKGPMAVLEVHNISNKDSGNTMSPIAGIGYESVVINGNLIVRGQSYLETPILRLSTMVKVYNKNTGGEGHLRSIPKGLVAYKLDKVGNLYSFFGYDGMKRDMRSYSACNRCDKRRKVKYNKHVYNDLRTNCICTTVGSYDGNTNYASGVAKNTFRGSSTSYDWISASTGEVVNADWADKDRNHCRGYHTMGARYTDQVTGKSRIIERNSDFYHTNSLNNEKYAGIGPTHSNYTVGSDQPLAHLKGAGGTANGAYFGGKIYSSCCPNLTTGAANEQDSNGQLTSDARLKNIGDKFTAGLAELKRLNIYNFTFKNDVRKLPQVGVMAQDLKMVFPNAVSKDKDGYYQIRWDEMFYAVINSVKELNVRIEKLASKISTDKTRVAALKKDNQELNAKLDKLEAELNVLETKK